MDAITLDEYAAVKEVEHMSDVEIIRYVDRLVVSTREKTMPEYRMKAVELKLEERNATESNH